MNYQKHYDLLVSRARVRGSIDQYTERHHIIPKSLGGNNQPGNLVRLTAAEHLVAHLLLVKIYPGNIKLAVAAYMMSNGSGERSNNKQYSWLKKKSLMESVKNGKVNGTRAFVNKTGIFGFSSSELSQRAKRMYSRGVGIAALNKKQLADALSKEQRSLYGKKNVSNMNIPYKCQQCNMITNAGNMTKHQIASGHIGRTRL